MAINFPDTPTVNQSFTVGSVTWIWNGTTWTSATSTPDSINPLLLIGA